jgi:hypothetical protein
MKGGRYLLVLGMLLCAVEVANAQTTHATIGQQSANSVQPPTANSQLIDAVRENKSNSEDLLRLQEEEVVKATQKLEQLRQLFNEGLIAKNELDASEESLTALKATLESTRKKIGDSDRMIADIQSAESQRAEFIAQAAAANKTRSFLRPTVLRYNGAANWSLSYLSGIQNFFSSTFGRPLPTSTVGQSATHNRLGWDHRNAVDVGVHPDSVEGKMLINFLQTQGIPFLAFRGAIPGVSTGPHIHIGRPSQRLT